MELDNIIHSRRTCRDYSTKKVPMNLIGEILDVCRFAPSSANIQNWQFIVVTNQDKREKISDICRNQSWMADAPVHLIICNKRDEGKSIFKESGEFYCIQNCAIIAANIILKAHDVGLASAIVGALDPYEMQKLLHMPDDVIPDMVITIGYPNSLDEDQFREEMKYLTYFEEWGQKDRENDIWPLSKHVKAATKKIKQATNRAKAKLIKR